MLELMKRLFCIFGALLLVGAMAAAQQGGTLEVQVHYTGSGTVDAKHQIFVALWDTPDPNGIPIAVKPTPSKNGTVTFSDVQKGPTYASVAYDPSGNWDASSPPPPGSSLGMYSKTPPKPEPITIVPGKVAKVTISFDDSNKVQ